VDFKNRYGSCGWLRLLISVLDCEEAVEAVEGGADIVDVKNPKEGCLGANFPWIIKEVRRITPTKVEVSATLGDLPYLPGTASLASSGAAASGAQYVKAGLYGVRSVTEGVTLMRNVGRALREYAPKGKVIAAGYADYRVLGCLNPMKLPSVAHKAEADGVMVDVRRKDGRKLFHYLQPRQLRKFVKEAHELGLTVALAGSLGAEGAARAKELEADILGVRRAACINNGGVSRFLVRRLACAVRD